MSKFLNKPVRIVNSSLAGKEGITVRFTDEQRSGIWVQFKDKKEVAFAPNQLWFIIEKKEKSQAA